MAAAFPLAEAGGHQGYLTAGIQVAVTLAVAEMVVQVFLVALSVCSSAAVLEQIRNRVPAVLEPRAQFYLTHLWLC